MTTTTAPNPSAESTSRVQDNRDVFSTYTRARTHGARPGEYLSIRWMRPVSSSSSMKPDPSVIGGALSRQHNKSKMQAESRSPTSTLSKRALKNLSSNSHRSQSGQSRLVRFVRTANHTRSAQSPRPAAQSRLPFAAPQRRNTIRITPQLEDATRVLTHRSQRGRGKRRRGRVLGRHDCVLLGASWPRAPKVARPENPFPDGHPLTCSSILSSANHGFQACSGVYGSGRGRGCWTALQRGPERPAGRFIHLPLAPQRLPT